MKITLVLGGARSGKSSYAMKLTSEGFRKPLYIATAEAFDEEMKERIRHHRKARGRGWQCIEEPLDLAGAVKKAQGKCDVILIDCVTVWLSNVIVKEGESKIRRREREFKDAVKNSDVPVIVVSNEVGLGIVPEHELGSNFRDHAGRLNQDLAELADKVVFVAAGIPMILKGGKS